MKDIYLKDKIFLYYCLFFSFNCWKFLSRYISLRGVSALFLYLLIRGPPLINQNKIFGLIGG